MGSGGLEIHRVSTYVFLLDVYLYVALVAALYVALCVSPADCLVSYVSVVLPCDPNVLTSKYTVA